MPNIPTEYEEACVLADWLRLNNILFSHIPHETFTKNWGTKMKNKRQGVSRGVPDYLCLVKSKKGYHLVFIELKRTKGGTVSKDQKAWIEALNKCDNCQAFVAKGAEHAINIIKNIIKII